jgi:ABC-2 type transport system permease protein/oleandomycin transport system permease protein
VIAERNLLRYLRSPDLLVFSTIQPVMFVLLFNYVFGGAIGQETGGNYINFLLPGVIVQTSIFGATQTGIGLNDDLSKGLVDRFRSLPMARAAVLAGRIIADTVRNLFVIVLMIGVGYAIGFRFENGPISAVGAIGMATAFAMVFSWISAFIGVSVKSVEAVQAASFTWIFPLTFLSSAFVPVASMPGWLQAFAKVNPMTLAVDAIRGMSIGGPVAEPAWQAGIWMVGILVVFIPLAVNSYRRAS